MKAHGVLCHLRILVAGGEVAQGTDGGLCDVLSVSRPEYCPHKGLDTSHLIRDVKIWERRS